LSSQPLLLSIYDLHPAEDGGRSARQGYEYQDHVAASFCLDLLDQPKLDEVWCENHDDVTLIWTASRVVSVEFVQVKSDDLPHRWSIARIKQREANRPGTSILEKSLLRARCKEDVSFRLVTQVDVDGELEVLKLGVGHPNRTAELVAAIQAKVMISLDGVKSECGLSPRDWVDRCIWDVRGAELAIEDRNKHRLNSAIHTRGFEIAPDHLHEVYISLLAFVQEKSAVDLVVEPNGHRVCKARLDQWLDDRLNRLGGYPGMAGVPEKLQVKMQRCGLADDIISGAEDLRRAYRQEKLKATYVPSESLQAMELEVTATLQSALSSLDAGQFSGAPVQFHDHCLTRVEQLRAHWPTRLPMPSLAFFQGYMYERTNRCVHRFDPAKP
jgi:hypothetical protein